MERTSKSNFGTIVYLLLIGIILAIIGWNMISSSSILNIAVNPNRVSDHGLFKHPEAQKIEDACNKDVYQIWRDKWDKKYYYLCQIGPDKWGIIPVIVVKTAEVWKTAFSPGGGSWTEVVDYLGRTATRYTGPVR